MLQATLGLSIDAWEKRITFNQPRLPPWLERLDISGLAVRDGCVDLSIVRGRMGAASIELVDRQRDVDVVVRK